MAQQVKAFAPSLVPVFHPWNAMVEGELTPRDVL